MKIGICLLLLASQQDPLANASIPTAAAAGYDYAEAPLARLLSLSDEELKEYREGFLAAGLPVEVFNNAIPRDIALIGPSAREDTLARYMERALFLADFFGVSLITMSGPNRRTVPETYTWNQGFPRYVDFLRRFSNLAAAQGVALAIEPINDEEHSFVSTVPEALRAVNAAGSRNLAAMVDTYHFLKQGDCMDDVTANIEKIAHIHCAAKACRTYPLAGDMEECRRFLSPVLSAGYKGRLSVEAYAPDPARDLPESARLLRGLLSGR